MIDEKLDKILLNLVKSVILNRDKLFENAEMYDKQVAHNQIKALVIQSLGKERIKLRKYEDDGEIRGENWYRAEMKKIWK